MTYVHRISAVYPPNYIVKDTDVPIIDDADTPSIEKKSLGTLLEIHNYHYLGTCPPHKKTPKKNRDDDDTFCTKRDRKPLMASIKIETLVTSDVMLNSKYKVTTVITHLGGSCALEAIYSYHDDTLCMNKITYTCDGKSCLDCHIPSVDWMSETPIEHRP